MHSFYSILQIVVVVRVYNKNESLFNYIHLIITHIWCLFFYFLFYWIFIHVGGDDEIKESII